MLRLRLNEVAMPFSEEVIYIFDQQIEEANILVVNKMDLLDSEKRSSLITQTRNRWPEKCVIPQSSLTVNGVAEWVKLIESGEVGLPKSSLDIDYLQYGLGEQKLTWLDMLVEVEAGQAGAFSAARSLVDTFMKETEIIGLRLGHAKFVMRGSDGGNIKISLLALKENEPLENFLHLKGERLEVLVNIRAEWSVDELQTWFTSVLDTFIAQIKGTWRAERISVFTPEIPKPLYRLP
jgi:hypothetical protein